MRRDATAGVEVEMQGQVEQQPHTEEKAAGKGGRSCVLEGAQTAGKHQEKGSPLSLQWPVPCRAQGRAPQFLSEADDNLWES